jgi:hypothetical protein
MCGKTWKLCRKMRRPYHESTLCTKLALLEVPSKFSLFFLPIPRKEERFREVSLKLSLKTALSNIYIIF